MDKQKEDLSEGAFLTTDYSGSLRGWPSP